GRHRALQRGYAVGLAGGVRGALHALVEAGGHDARPEPGARHVPQEGEVTVLAEEESHGVEGRRLAGAGVELPGPLGEGDDALGDVYPRRAQVGGDGLAGLRVLRVAARGVRVLEGEAVRVAGLGEELPRALWVVRVDLEVRVEARVVVSEELPGHGRAA